MDPVHIHLFLNHVPIVGSFAAVLLLAYGAIRKSDEVMRVGLVALVLTALVAIPVYLTGEPSEDIVEKLPGVSEAFMEEHEDAGKLALIAAIVTGAVSLVSIFLAGRGQKVGKAFVWISIALSLVTAAAMVRTGNLGGQIRHTEIRAAGTGTQQTQTGETKAPQASQKDKDDDDH
ncbi:MAG TPA: hypothetical protein VHL50_05060 [Pyrinomonadaceae bacterium]|jgi:uncharacterized membrane protein|nr:hypothetical protein [Pyrinomonadaceae bacterium]